MGMGKGAAPCSAAVSRSNNGEWRWHGAHYKEGAALVKVAAIAIAANGLQTKIGCIRLGQKTIIPLRGKNFKWKSPLHP